jgi:hypothetical protein
MISRKIVATQFPPDRDPSAERGHQGPMPLQNSRSLASCESHPQELVRLTGCRDLNAANRNLGILHLEESGRQH